MTEVSIKPSAARFRIQWKVCALDSPSSAVNELFDFGRPERIELAVLVDRGGRELPIEATYVGATITMPRDRTIVLSRDPGGTLSLAVEPLAGVA